MNCYCFKFINNEHTIPHICGIHFCNVTSHLADNFRTFSAAAAAKYLLHSVMQIASLARCAIKNNINSNRAAWRKKKTNFYAVLRELIYFNVIEAFVVCMYMLDEKHTQKSTQL